MSHAGGSRRRKVGAQIALVAFCTTAMAFGASASGASAVAQKKPIGPSVTFNFEDYNASSDPATIWAQQYAAQVQRDTGGAVKINVYPNSELVSQAGAPNALETNSIQMGFAGLAALAPTSPYLPGIDLPVDPFMTPTYGAAKAVAQSAKVRNLINTVLPKVGLRLVASCVQAPNAVASTVPLTSISDFQGLKIRVANTGAGATQSALGALPTVLSIGSVYQAFLLKTFTAAVSSVPNSFLYSWYQVAKYMDMIPFSWVELQMFVNSTAYAQLNAAEKQVLIGDALRSAESCDKAEQKANLTDAHAMEQSGTQLVYPKSLAPFIAAERSLTAQEQTESPLAVQLTKLFNQFNREYKS